jgi:hypothetical protein
MLQCMCCPGKMTVKYYSVTKVEYKSFTWVASIFLKENVCVCGGAYSVRR